MKNKNITVNFCYDKNLQLKFIAPFTKHSMMYKLAYPPPFTHKYGRLPRWAPEEEIAPYNAVD